MIELKFVNPNLSKEQIIEKLRGEHLIKAYRELGVVVVYLYGGYARGETSPFSDVDISIILAESVPREKYLDV